LRDAFDQWPDLRRMVNLEPILQREGQATFFERFYNTSERDLSKFRMWTPLTLGKTFDSIQSDIEFELARLPDVADGRGAVHSEVEQGTSKGGEVQKPSFNPELGQLSYGGRIIRQVRDRGDAPNVWTILIAFEDDKWNRSIDDPLGGPGDPVTRLHNAIASLKNGLEGAPISFQVYKKATKIRWIDCPEKT
jgi:hypothetical protein